MERNNGFINVPQSQNISIAKRSKTGGSRKFSPAALFVKENLKTLRNFRRGFHLFLKGAKQGGKAEGGAVETTDTKAGFFGGDK